MHPIAIIGVAGIFPKAHNAREYWNNILDKVSGITDVPPSRWRIEDYYDPDPKAPDKVYSKRGGFIPDIPFDPLEFGLPPNILEVTDVSQLLALVVARDLLEDAGYHGPRARPFNRQRVGVVLGVGGGQKLVTALSARLQYPVWERVLRSCGLSETETHHIVEKMKLAYVAWTEDAFPGLLGNVIAGRIANRFNLGGMNCVVDAACASSLAALKMALSHLEEGRADMMISGGVDTDNSPFMYMCFSKTPALSPGEVPRPFDEAADGMMVGEGLGMVLLKRLEDAERDGDHIYAVIRGIGTSSDGRYKSIYAPRPEGQALALRRAYDDAGFPPQSVGLIEAHGTGTRAGDPAEFAGLRLAFGEGDEGGPHIALGSVKSQIGHTKAAAGAAGLIKAALALHQKVLPPTNNVTRPNPKLDIEHSPFYLNTERRPWVRPEGSPPRRAGVSAFGFGGTNFHVVLEEYEAEHNTAYRWRHVARPLLFHAPTSADLLARCEAALHSDSETWFHQAAVAGRTTPPRDAARLGFITNTLDEALNLLRTAVETMQAQPDAEAWNHPRGLFYRRAGLDTSGKLVALFPGQGAQYLNMGRDLTINFPPLRRAFARMDRLFIEDGQPPLSAVVFPPPAFDEATRKAQEAALRATDYAQAAIGVLSMGMFQLLRQAGFRPAFAAGHSFGELSALWAGGILDDDSFLTLVRARGRAMLPPSNAHTDAGGMLAVKGAADEVRAEIAAFEAITLANDNSPRQVVLAGPTAALTQVEQALTAKGFTVRRLPVAAAFHTPLVGHAAEPFARAVAATPFHPPTIPVYANTTAEPYPADPNAARRLLAGHILNPVRFRQQIEAIYAAGGRIFVEFGPRSITTHLVEEILEGRPHIALALNPSRRRPDDRQFREAVLRLRVLGVELGEVDPYDASPLAPHTSHP